MAINITEVTYVLRANNGNEFTYTREQRKVALRDRNSARKANPSLNWALYQVITTTVTSLVEDES